MRIREDWRSHLRRPRTTLLCLALSATLLWLPSARSEPSLTSIDPVRSWNEQALATARAKILSDAQAARLYAMVNAAMYDAVNGVVIASHGPGRGTALVSPEGAPKHADAYSAAVTAAHAVLSGEFPDRAAIYTAERDAELAQLPSKKATDDGAAWGADVGARVRAARTNDGSSPNEPQAAGAGPGQFRASWNGVQFRNLAPFAIADPSVYVGAGPAALSSVDYAAALAEVKLLGNRNIADDAKLSTYNYWSLGNGTSQPPGAWIQVGLRVTESHPLPLHDATRLFTLIGVSMADTVAPTVTTKALYRHWRPATAIAEAGSDGNDYTDPLPAGTTWTQRAPNIGTSPEYWSGHSSFSAAGAAALAGFFCSDDIPFSLVTDSAPGGQTRTYPSFSSAAAEAGISRVFGGIHFSFSNRDGLGAGRAVAREVLATALLPTAGPTHHGACPL